MLIILCCVGGYVASVFLCRWMFIIEARVLYGKNHKKIKTLCEYNIEHNLILILFPVVNFIVCILTLIYLFIDFLNNLRLFIFLSKPISSFINWFLCR